MLKLKQFLSLKLISCVLGIYTCFFIWGLLQEKLTTTNYTNDNDIVGKRYTFFVTMNLTQSIIACVCAYIYGLISGHTVRFPPFFSKLSQLYAIIGLTSCLASPLGYASLEYINFPTMILGKSCKLVPVMLVQTLLYRRKFPWFKYLSVALVTLGVYGFFYFDPKKRGEQHANSFYGLFLLFSNLLLDGFTNSTEDTIHERYHVNSTNMMFFLNFSQSCLMALYLLFNPWGTELFKAAEFFVHYPQSIIDIVMFALAGSLGQMVIFYTLEQFGSITLVTITVTRKLFSIVLSVITYGHVVSFSQWTSVAVVFLGIITESVFKSDKKHPKLVEKKDK